MHIPEYTAEERERLVEMLPHLNVIMELTKNAPHLFDLFCEASKARQIAERGLEFDIWTESSNPMYGVYIGTVRQIYNDKKWNKGSEEDLLTISFPTGGYVFGEPCDREFFEEFYKKLRNSAVPDYEDNMSYALYYKPARARFAIDTYKKVYYEYQEKFKLRWGKIRNWYKIEQLMEEIDIKKNESEGR